MTGILPHRRSAARPASGDTLFPADTVQPENPASSRQLPDGIPRPACPGSLLPSFPIDRPAYPRIRPGLLHTTESIASVQSPIDRSSDDSIYVSDSFRNRSQLSSDPVQGIPFLNRVLLLNHPAFPSLLFLSHYMQTLCGLYPKLFL